VTRAPLGGDDDEERLDRTIGEWSAEWRASGTLLAIDHRSIADDRGHFHWLIRLKGEEKDSITLWLSLRQRTVHVETQVMPAPEENIEALYRFALVKNAEMRELHLALGPEDGLYLVSQIPILEVTSDRLDEVVGATLAYVDEIYPTVMALGLPRFYRRRPPR
jgi:hypothetical protein